jgi:MFS family permease
MSDRRGRRALMRLGLYGFIGSMLICGTVLAIGLEGLMPPTLVFFIFMLGRSTYGIWGSASPPAVQAYVAARTDGEQRTNALSLIASSFGLGTIIGPALAPLFVFPPLGLSGPLFAFALIGVAVLTALVLRLPDDTPPNAARGRVPDYPSMGGPPAPEPVAQQDGGSAALRWRDPRIFPWHVIGVVGGHGQAALLGVIGFLVIDRLELQPSEAQQWIAIVLMVGAAATLLGQWWLIPQLRLQPRGLVGWGCALAAAGTVATGLAQGVYGLTLGFALASLGFGLFRPGFTSGASLAVSPEEQNAVAGMVTSVNGVAYIAGPAVGVGLYGIWMPLPFLVTGAMMVGLALWVSLRPSPSAHAA